MDLLRRSLLAAIERLAGIIMLVLIGPFLLVIGVLVRVTAGSPVILRDSIVMEDGAVAYSYRFRTTGAGTSFFHGFGRFLRKYAWDELLVFWSVARGEIRLKNALNLGKP